MRGMRIAILACAALMATAMAARAAPIELSWEVLRGADPTPAETLTTTDMLPVGARYDGQEIRIEGYMLPVDREGDKVYEFLLVPFAGACSHMPQPPANQLIHVFPSQAYVAKGNYEPISVTGKFRAEPDRLQFFMVDGTKVVDVDFALSGARVAHSDALAAPPATQNPLLRSRK